MRAALTAFACAVALTALAAASGGAAATDPVVAALRHQTVHLAPGTGVGAAQAGRLRTQAARLALAGYPTRFAVLPFPPPAGFIAYSARVRAGVGQRTNVVLVWVLPGAAGRAVQFAYAFDSPASTTEEARAQRQTLRADRARTGRGGALAFAADLAERLSWAGQPPRLPVAGPAIQLDADPGLERLARVPAGVAFPALSVPGFQFAVIDNGRARRIGTPGERVEAPLVEDHLGTGSAQILLRLASGNSLFTTELLAWSGSRALTLWRYRAKDLEAGNPDGTFVGEESGVTFPDLDGDGVDELVVRAPALECRACEPASIQVGTYRYDPSAGRYLLAGVTSEAL